MDSLKDEKRVEEKGTVKVLHLGYLLAVDSDLYWVNVRAFHLVWRWAE